MTKKWAYLPEEHENLNEIILYIEKLVLHSFCEEVLSGVRYSGKNRTLVLTGGK